MEASDYQLPLLNDDERVRAIYPTAHSASARDSSSLQRNKAHGRLYLSHFLSTWNSRVFEFGAVLYLAEIFPGTLMPMSIYALCRGSSAVILSPAVGRLIDTSPRLQVVRASIVFQRLAVVVSCLMLYVMATGLADQPWLRLTLLAVLSLIACVEKLYSVMNQVAVERDWVVVVAGDSETDMRNLNSQMRRIDLICKLMGPFVISIADGYSTATAIVINLAMNLLSLPIEYYAIRCVYDSTPSLQQAKPDRDSARVSSRTWKQSSEQLQTQLSNYFHHRAMRPSLAGALLYLTVLSFSGQMVTYLLAVGFTSISVALARTLSVMFELSATFIAPLTISHIGAIRSGIWFLSWQMLCLALGVSAFFLITSPFGAAIGLVTGTIFSRVGLWGFDLSIQIIVQEEVEAQLRGSFSAVEASLQNACELVSFAATVVWSRPEQFRWPVVGSCVAVYLAGVLYAWFVRTRRGHLVHFCDGLGSRKRRVISGDHREEATVESLGLVTG